MNYKMKSALKLALLVAGLAGSASAQAAYVINIVQSGTDVVATGSGSLDVNALGYASQSLISGFLNGNPAYTVSVGSGGAVNYGGVIALSGNFTSNAGMINSSSDTGAPVLVGIGQLSVANYLIPTNGFYSSALLGTSTSTYNNTTLTGLGLINGNYTYSWGSGANADTIQLNIGPPVTGSVPEPATWASMLAGFGLMGFAMRRQKQIVRVRYA